MKRWGCCALLLWLICAMQLPAVAAAEDRISGVLYERMTLHAGYDSTPIGEEEVRLILQAGFSGPTGGNQRSLEFFVVTDRQVMRRIQEGHPYAGALDTAPLVIVVAGNALRAFYPELHEMDSGAAAMAMMVQATQLGLSSCVLSISPQESRVAAARDALGMPESYVPVLMVAFGYPAADTVSSASVYGYEEARVHRNGYAGGPSETDATSGPTPAADDATPAAGD